MKKVKERNYFKHSHFGTDLQHYSHYYSISITSFVVILFQSFLFATRITLLFTHNFPCNFFPQRFWLILPQRILAKHPLDVPTLSAAGHTKEKRVISPFWGFFYLNGRKIRTSRTIKSNERKRKEKVNRIYLRLKRKFLHKRKGPLAQNGWRRISYIFHPSINISLAIHITHTMHEEPRREMIIRKW